VIKPAAAAPVSWMQAHYDKLVAGLSAANEAALGKVTASGGRVAPLGSFQPVARRRRPHRPGSGHRRQGRRDRCGEGPTRPSRPLCTAITDAGLVPVTGMPRLTRLDLHSTKVTDAGLKNLTESCRI